MTTFGKLFYWIILINNLIKTKSLYWMKVKIYTQSNKKISFTLDYLWKLWKNHRDIIKNCLYRILLCLENAIPVLWSWLGWYFSHTWEESYSFAGYSLKYLLCWDTEVTIREADPVKYIEKQYVSLTANEWGTTWGTGVAYCYRFYRTR